MYLKSPSLGKRHICDSSGLTTGNYKALPGRLHGESCPPHTRLGAQPVHDSSLERVAVKDPGSPGPSILIHISSFLTQALPFKGFLIRASAEVLSSTSIKTTLLGCLG